jgi:periplasmic protein CpxP/Spy
MKKTILMSTLLLLLVQLAGAQPGGRGMRRTVEERVKMIHDKLDSAFNKEVPAAKMTEVDSAFAAFYRAQDKMREELMSAGGPPDEATREAMRAKMQELNAERDGKLQKILTEAQYNKWKNEIEPSLRPRGGMRGGGGPGGGGQ